MNKYAGVWIDYKKAFIVLIEGENETVTRIESDVGGRVRLSGGSRSATPYGPQEVASEKKLEQKRKHYLNKYYERLIDAIRDANKILILGPGEAKLGLEKKLRKSKVLCSRIADIQAADKVTEKQLVAKVREFFPLPRF